MENEDGAEDAVHYGVERGTCEGSGGEGEEGGGDYSGEAGGKGLVLVFLFLFLIFRG